MSIQLFSHNQTAYDSALAMLESCGKAGNRTSDGNGIGKIITNPRKNIMTKTERWISLAPTLTRAVSRSGCGCGVSAQIK